MKAKINDYNEREQNLDDNEQKYLNYLNQIIILLTENLGYCLKILNQIYRGIKKEEEKVNYFKALKYIFSEKSNSKKFNKDSISIFFKISKVFRIKNS